MNQEIAVSVIVPIYNVQAYLQECIESILAQSLSEIEIILVDDGGTDECPSICDRYAAQDARVKVIHKPNGGLISARQAGAEIAKGVYIGFVDGDDMIGSEFYKTLYQAAKDENADMVCSGYTVWEEDCKTPVLETCVEHGVYRRAEIETEIFPHLICEDITYGRMIDSVCSKIFRRETFCKYGINMPKEIGTWEDFGFSRAAMMISQRIVVLKCTEYYYRQIKTSMSHSYINGYRDQVLHVYHFLLHVANLENVPETVFEQLKRYRAYWGGTEILLRECSSGNPGDFRTIYNRCKALFDAEEQLLACRNSHWAKDFVNMLCRLRSPLLTAMFIITARGASRLKRRFARC